MARPKRFELLTPRFVHGGGALILLGFSEKLVIMPVSKINDLASALQNGVYPIIATKERTADVTIGDLGNAIALPSEGRGREFESRRVRQLPLQKQ
jgi:hypothetical protein